MVLTIDVGNTNITVGVFDRDEDKMEATFRITTKMPRTSDEYAMVLSTLLEKNNISVHEIHDAIICSVVPKVMHSLEGALIKYFDIQPIVVGAGIKTGIRIATTNPQQVGADRIVDAVAAYEIYGGPVLVLDFGTATTYDLVDGNGTFLCAVTAPGLRISAQALWEEAAKLPEIEIKLPDTIMAKDTVASMQAGLVYGQIGQTEYIIKKIKEQAGIDNIKVVATGGLGRVIAEETDSIDVYDNTLTLKGIYRVYKKQNRKKAINK
ncbi:type III pantothenate kinase [Lachnospiraceae bacterium C7]|nr:type III pantothenate kinase [Lachnospiraceae bacterium C7]